MTSLFHFLYIEMRFSCEIIKSPKSPVTSGNFGDLYFRAFTFGTNWCEMPQNLIFLLKKRLQ